MKLTYAGPQEARSKKMKLTYALPHQFIANRLRASGRKYGSDSRPRVLVWSCVPPQPSQFTPSNSSGAKYAARAAATDPMPSPDWGFIGLRAPPEPPRNSTLANADAMQKQLLVGGCICWRSWRGRSSAGAASLKKRGVGRWSDRGGFERLA